MGKEIRNIRVVDAADNHTLIEVTFDYGLLGTWQGRISVPYRNVEDIKRELREAYHQKKPFKGSVVMPREFDLVEPEAPQ